MAAIKRYSYPELYYASSQMGAAEKEALWNGRRGPILYGSASTKAEFVKAARGFEVSIEAKEVRLASGTDFDALAEASLLDGEGVVIAIRDGGGDQPVGLFEPGRGLQLIGVVKPNPVRFGTKIFHAQTARHAGPGSIAAGKEEVFINTGRAGDRRWASTWGYSHGDEQMERMLDMDGFSIIRSGYGDWHPLAH